MPYGVDFPDHDPGFSVRVGFGKVRAHPFFKALGLSHIEDLPFGVEELIDPRAVGQGF